MPACARFPRDQSCSLEEVPKDKAQERAGSPAPGALCFHLSCSRVPRPTFSSPRNARNGQESCQHRSQQTPGNLLWVKGPAVCLIQCFPSVLVHTGLFQVYGNSPENITKSHAFCTAAERGREGPGRLTNSTTERPTDRLLSDKPKISCLWKILQLCDEDSEAQPVSSGELRRGCATLPSPRHLSGATGGCGSALMRRSEAGAGVGSRAGERAISTAATQTTPPVSQQHPREVVQYIITRLRSRFLSLKSFSPKFTNFNDCFGIIYKNK